jgi:hypothetical protein
MINLKACARCGGDVIPEELLDDIDLVCLQCGHRTPGRPLEPLKRPFSAWRESGDRSSARQPSAIHPRGQTLLGAVGQGARSARAACLEGRA